MHSSRGRERGGERGIEGEGEGESWCERGEGEREHEHLALERSGQNAEEELCYGKVLSAHLSPSLPTTVSCNCNLEGGLQMGHGLQEASDAISINHLFLFRGKIFISIFVLAAYMMPGCQFFAKC